MRKLLIIFLALILSSCNPFISKELRRKNKCNRKLERVLRKCPELIKTDTVMVRFDSTIITKEVKVDTFVSLHFDTFELIKDKFHLKLIKSFDTLIINGGCEPDTVILKQYIKVPVKTFSKIELTPMEKAANFLGSFWWFFVIAILLIAVLFILKNLFYP